MKPLSLFDRFQTFAQGGIDTRDVSFLVLFTATFLELHVLRARRAALARGALVSGEGAGRSGRALVLQVALLLTGVVGLQIAAEHTSRRVDLTPTHDLSLSPVSEQVLKQLDAPLRATVFHRRGRRAQIAPLLERMHAANPAFEYELLDLDRFPERAQGARRRTVRLGGARVPGPAHRRARAARGRARRRHRAGAARAGAARALHGRARRAGAARAMPGSVGRFVRRARRRELRDRADLARSPTDLPAGTELVVVAGPQYDFLQGEVERLATYLRGGGAVLLLLEPGPLPNLAALLASMGIRIADDFLVDRERSVIGTDGLAAIVELFKRGNPISEPGGTVMETGAVLPSARSVDVTGECRASRPTRSRARRRPRGRCTASTARAAARRRARRPRTCPAAPP